MPSVPALGAGNGLNTNTSSDAMYTVRSGDTLSGIAAAHGVSLSALEQANPHIDNPNLIFPGQEISIPAGGGSGGSSNGQAYTVQSGDTLSGIAAAHGVSLSALEQANPQISNPNLIYPGERVNIPGSGDPADGSSGSGSAGGSQGVKPGPSGPQPASGGTPATLQGRINAAMSYFESQGWTRAQAAGIVANLQAESGLNPNIQQYGGGPGYGLAQWEGPRQAAFAAWAGHDIHSATFNEELQFVQFELTHSESAAGNALRGATSAGNAAAIVTQLYERPADIAGQSQYRAGLAQQIYAGPAP